MKTKNRPTLFIVICILIFLFGVALGVIIVPKVFQPARNNTTNTLTSKVVVSIVAYGQVKNVNGKNIILDNLGDKLSIKIADDAQIYYFVENKNSAPTQVVGKFSDIKIGDSVNVALRMLPTGQLEGSSVIIFP